MHGFAEWLLQYRWPILLASGAVIIAITSLIPSNKLGEKWHEYFDESFEIRHAIEATERHFGGIHILQFDMRGPEPGSINDPRYLADLEKFATWLEQQPEVTNVRRISQLIERLNMNLHGDDPSGAGCLTRASLQPSCCLSTSCLYRSAWALKTLST